MKAIDFAGGVLSIEHRKLYDEYVNVDILDKDPENGTKYKTDVYSDLNFLKKLPYPDKYFDVVRAEMILEHLTNIYPLIGEMNRLAKSTIKIAVPNALAYDNRISVLFGVNRCYPNPFKDILSHHMYFDYNAAMSFCEHFFPEFKVRNISYKCYGRFGSIFKHFIKIRPTLFATEIHLELERIGKM